MNRRMALYHRYVQVNGVGVVAPDPLTPSVSV